jgi:hypothetical protein
MSIEPNHQDDLVLPLWMGKIVAIVVFLVSLALIYYGIHDGIIDQNIAFRTKSGQISIGAGGIAIVIGVVFSGIGIALARVALLIFKSSKLK